MKCPVKSEARRDAVRLLLFTLLALVLTVGAAAIGFAPFRLCGAGLSAPLPDLDEAVRINVNEAGLQELRYLPGVGTARAAQIIEYRELHGPYRSLQDLCHVDGIDLSTIHSWGSMAYTTEHDAEGS